MGTLVTVLFKPPPPTTVDVPPFAPVSADVELELELELELADVPELDSCFPVI